MIAVATRASQFIRRERLYLLLLIFIIELNLLVWIASSQYHGSSAAAHHKKGQVSAAVRDGKEGVTWEGEQARHGEMKKALAENPRIAVVLGLASLLIVTVLLLGIIIDGLFLGAALRRKPITIATYRLGAIRWGLWDVGKVVILFLFFGYMIVIVESLVAGIVPALKNHNVRMMLNSAILDGLSVAFIITFALKQHGEKLIALGLSLKNFVRNVFYGIVGYIAAVPVLVAVLLAIIALTNLLRYVPPQQPVVELFMKEENTAFLTFTSIFAAIVGPMIEELFFRGFLYNAVKRHIGIVWAMVVTAAFFAALHTNLVGFLPIMILGLVLAYLYEKTGTLVAPITVHIIHNLSMVFFVFLLKHLQV